MQEATHARDSKCQTASGWRRRPVASSPVLLISAGRPFLSPSQNWNRCSAFASPTPSFVFSSPAFTLPETILVEFRSNPKGEVRRVNSPPSPRVCVRSRISLFTPPPPACFSLQPLIPSLPPKIPEPKNPRRNTQPAVRPSPLMHARRTGRSANLYALNKTCDKFVSRAQLRRRFAPPSSSEQKIAAGARRPLSGRTDGRK